MPFVLLSFLVDNPVEKVEKSEKYDTYAFL